MRVNSAGQGARAALHRPAARASAHARPEATPPLPSPPRTVATLQPGLSLLKVRENTERVVVAVFGVSCQSEDSDGRPASR